MSMDLYVQFKRPLTADELTEWSGVSVYTDYDLKRAQLMFDAWTSLCSYDYITVTSLFDYLSGDMQKRIIINKIRDLPLRHPLSDKQVAWLATEVLNKYSSDESSGRIWYWKGEILLELAGVCWDACEHGPYAFLFNRFFGDYDWQTAMLGRRWWVGWIVANINEEYLIQENGHTYLEPCGALDQPLSEKLTNSFTSQLNRLGKFPADLVDYYYWG